MHNPLGKFFCAVYAEVAIVIYILNGLVIPADAQEAVKACAGVDVQSITTSSLTDNLVIKPPENLKITLVQENTIGKQKILTVSIIGPELDVTVFPEMKTELLCTSTGITLITTIARSVKYNGSVRANYLWHPETAMKIILSKPEMLLKAKWIMRLSTGVLVENAGRPLFPDEKPYPIIIEKVLRN